MTKMRSHICAALAHSNLSVMGKMQLKMANSFYVRIAQNTKKPCEFYERSGCKHNGGLATRGRQNQRHELCALFKSHRALYSQVTPIGRVKIIPHLSAF